MDDDLRNVARTIRPYLAALVGSEASDYDREIARLLSKADSGSEIDEQLADLLARSPTICSWAAEVLGDELYRPPEVRALVERGIEPLPGIGEPVDAQKYVCAVDGNFVWWRTSVGVPIPKCPDHNAVLVRA
jgi:hypothetical protein